MYIYREQLAMSYGLPVVAMNKFGAAVILDDKIGWLYDGTTKEEYINNLKDILVDCIKNPDKAIAHSKSARTAAEQYLWQIKLKEYISGSF